MKPIRMSKVDTTALLITWDNGHESRYTLELLREICPCAGCSGETILMREYKPPEPDRTTPGRYELKGIQPVGSYAVQLKWGDGHETGIYTWDHLIGNCPCQEHSASG